MANRGSNDKCSAPPTVIGGERGPNANRLESTDTSILPWFDLRVDHRTLSEAGAQESSNEDIVLSCPELALFGLADGMGGHAAGEVAAQLSLDTVTEILSSEKARKEVRAYADGPTLDRQRSVCALLESAVHQAHQAVLTAAAQTEAQQGMGTTLDIALFIGSHVFLAHVGDARIFLVRPTTMIQLTHDHSSFDSLRSQGKRTPVAQLAARPLSNSIGQRKQLAVDTLAIGLRPGDRLIACTDGVFGNLPSESLLAKLSRNETAHDTCQRLLHAARDTGSRDDASIIAWHMGERILKSKADPASQAFDRDSLSACPLFAGLDDAALSVALEAGIEIDLEVDKELPSAAANDRACYIVLEGVVRRANGGTLGRSGLLIAESLLDIPAREAAPQVIERVRLLRIRYHDFEQVCAHDRSLAAELYKRLAQYLARTGTLGTR